MVTRIFTGVALLLCAFTAAADYPDRPIRMVVPVAPGGAVDVAGELFLVMAGIKLNHVPYKSAGPAINDLVAGHIPLMFGPSPVLEFAKFIRADVQKYAEIAHKANIQPQ